MASQPAWDLYPPAEVLDEDALLEEESADDEQWHVLMAPGEVKVLSLEQLDDFFRLEVIDENTLVWQEGMKDWAPLSLVAGMDADEKATEPLGAPPPAPPAPQVAPAPLFSEVVPAPHARAQAMAPAPVQPAPVPSAPPPPAFEPSVVLSPSVAPSAVT